MATKLKNIELDLDIFKIKLYFQGTNNPLSLHFDTSSRKFYFSLIALIVHEMKQQGQPSFVYIRKYEQLLKSMDEALAGKHASSTIDNMWGKIRKAWQYSLPNLEEAANFKLEGRDVITPYEKGGKYLSECTENECDVWANLFRTDDIVNKWRFKFAFDVAELDFSDVTLKFGDLKEDSAWDAFLKHLEKN
jgi:hypothetical protein